METPWVPDDGSFGARLALIRNRLGWNASEAARRCQVNKQSWRDWEAGVSKPRSMDEVVTRIADVTGCDVTWLMFGTEQPAVAS